MAAEHVVRMGRRIAQRREELGLSQNDLARLLPGKVGGQQVSKWERGIHKPHHETLEAIAKVLTVPVAYFMVDEPQEGTPDLMGALSEGDKLDEALSILKQLVERQEALEAAVTAMAELLAERLPQARQGQRRAS